MLKAVDGVWGKLCQQYSVHGDFFTTCWKAFKFKNVQAFKKVSNRFFSRLTVIQMLSNDKSNQFSA